MVGKTETEAKSGVGGRPAKNSLRNALHASFSERVFRPALALWSFHTPEFHGDCCVEVHPKLVFSRGKVPSLIRLLSDDLCGLLSLCRAGASTAIRGRDSRIPVPARPEVSLDAVFNGDFGNETRPLFTCALVGTGGRRGAVVTAYFSRVKRASRPWRAHITFPRLIAQAPPSLFNSNATTRVEVAAVMLADRRRVRFPVTGEHSMYTFTFVSPVDAPRPLISHVCLTNRQRLPASLIHPELCSSPTPTSPLFHPCD